MKSLTLLLICFIVITETSGQNIDNLKLYDNEIPAGYTLTNTNNGISIQARTLYDNPELYEMLIGKLKSKQIQNFDSKKDKGSIMYFEFEEEFKAETFLENLLWGVNKPSKEHPEEYYAKGNFLIIWSFKKGSPVTNTSKTKIVAALK